MDFNYTLYDHEVFNHLKFEVVDEWIIEQNDLEVVFLNVDQSLPQLHFQTIGKTESFNSASTFYTFLLTEDETGEIKNKAASKCGNFDSIEYEYIEKDYPEIYVYGVIVDVGEGILWFYLKTPSNNPSPYKDILTNLCQSLEFK